LSTVALQHRFKVTLISRSIVSAVSAILAWSFGRNRLCASSFRP